MQNLLTVIKALEKIGASLPDVHTVILSDIYQLNSLPNIDYSVFAIVQDQHRKDDNFTYLGFYLYYVDRLLNDKSNQIEIQSHGLEILSEVIDKIEDLGLILSPEFDRVLQPFNQRFSDECAGIYCRLEIMIPQDCMIAYDILVNPKLANLAVYQPGTYYPSDYGADGFRVVDVSGQSYEYYTENEADKTARIDNGYHNIVVDESGVTIDGQNNNKNIADLSGITSALTEQIGQLSGLTDDFVKKDPKNVEGTQQNPIDFNDLTAETGYYYVEVHNEYAINHPVENGWLPDGMLEVVRDPDSIRITQVFTANFGTIQAGDWPRRWYRVYCYLAEEQWGWTGWNEIANKGDIKTLSGLTSANTQAIATLSAQTSANTASIAYINASGISTDIYVRKQAGINGSGDFNIFKYTGFWCCGSLEGFTNQQHGPEANIARGILSVVAYNGRRMIHGSIIYQTQVVTQECTVFDINNNNAPRKYIRNFHGSKIEPYDGVWSDWYQITLTPVQQ